MQNGTIFIKAKKAKIYLHAAFALAMCALSLFLIFSGTAEETFSKILCWLAAAISALFLLILMPLIMQDTGILIEDKGITDCTKFSRIGPIPWKDIVSIETAKVILTLKKDGQQPGKTVSHEYIAAKLSPESKFSPIIEEINKNIMPGGGGKEIIQRLGLQTLIINPAMLNCHSGELLDLLKTMHEKNK